MEGMAAREAAPTGLTAFAKADGTDSTVRPRIGGSWQVEGRGSPSGGFIRSARPGRDKVDATVSGQ
eukprot:8357251-Alexandrium_andersonii.AAC.1